MEGSVLMRDAYHGEIFRDENGKFEGIDLGADFCAEHEWGIKDLQSTLAVDTSAIGLDRYLIQNTDTQKYLRVKEFTRHGQKFIGMVLYSSTYAFLLDKGNYVEPWNDDAAFWAAWDEKSLGITMPIKDRDVIDTLVDAMASKNCVIYIGNSRAFKNGGLTLALASAFPEEERQNIVDQHLDEIKLQKAVEKTGIKKKLKKAGKNYYALSPAWETIIENHTPTKYPVIFFLNPMEQSKNHAGWFTVEELLQWIKGTGPIPKQ